MLRYFQKIDKKAVSTTTGLTLEEEKRAEEEVKKVIEIKDKARGSYNDYSPEIRAAIGKYAAENGPTRASRHFTKQLGKNVPESTARRLKKEYTVKLSKLPTPSNEDDSSRAQFTVTSLPKQPQGRPLLLGELLDKSVQSYIESLRKVGGVVNTAIVRGAAHGIVSVRHPSLLTEHGGSVELGKPWAKSLLKRMGYVKRKCSNAGKVTVSRFEELKEEYLADIKAEVVMHDIHTHLIFNWDQTALHLVPTGQWTMHEAKAKIIPITNSDDKRQITAVLAVTMTGEYLPAQLLFQGKTVRCHPKIEAPPGWDIWHSINHWSNEETMLRYIEKVILPFVVYKRRELKLNEDSQALAIFDCFKGQTTQTVYDLLKSNHIRVVKVPANCTDKLQPLDISINKPMKEEMRKYFRNWYAESVRKQLEEGTPLEEVSIDVALSVIKNQSANWMFRSWETLTQKPEIAVNGFRKAEILQAVTSVL